MSSGAYNAHIYGNYKEVAICACAAATQTGIPLEFGVFGRSFDVLSGIWSEFDVMCFVLQGGARLLGHALLLGHIRYA